MRNKVTVHSELRGSEDESRSGYLDDWLGPSDFVMTEAIVMGYPSMAGAARRSAPV
jgi:hypothetical protein